MFFLLKRLIGFLMSSGYGIIFIYLFRRLNPEPCACLASALTLTHSPALGLNLPITCLLLPLVA